MNLQDLIDFLEDESNRLEKELLLEAMSEKSRFETTLEEQSETLEEHIIKLQLYGFESMALKTIYNCYNLLYKRICKDKYSKYLEYDKVFKLLNPFESENYYQTRLQLYNSELKDDWFDSDFKNADYNNAVEAVTFITKLLVANTWIDRNEFNARIRKILGI